MYTKENVFGLMGEKNKTLVLHWWGGSSEENWLPWLKKEIEFKVEDLFIPNLPNTDNPVIEEQLDYINIYSSDFSEWWNIIGHSLGCQLALKFVEENNIKNSTIILVAPSYPHLAKELVEILWNNFDILKKYYDTENNFEKINKLNNEFIIFLSDNDPYINMENAKKYYNSLENIKFVDFKWKWHFNQGAWVLELEEILEYLK